MTPLGRLIRETIAAEGPMRLDRYMSLCLTHPAHGYYATRDPFGARGDFITSPEISQMFGELIGLWCAEVWRMMGRPARFSLVELGPGRGAMMADMLRAAKAAPGFCDAAEVVLVEASPVLRAVQARALAGAPARWAGDIEEAFGGDPLPPAAERLTRRAPSPLPLAGEGRGEGLRHRGGVNRALPERTDFVRNPERHVPSSLPSPASGRRGGEPRDISDSPASARTTPLPAIVVANEFFDALPIRQFVRAEAGWRERLVGLAADGALAFGLAPEAPTDLDLPVAPPGAVREVCAEALDVAARIAAHVAAHGGATLAVDYGYAQGSGDTFQAVAAHGFVDPLDKPGEADLTAHVDFAALAASARSAGAATMRLVTQADLLERLGLHARSERLSAHARPDQRAAIAAAVARLTDRTPRGMGALFKALAFGDRHLGALPGFEPTA